MIKIIYPYKMVGEYTDGEEIFVGGFDEEDCMYKLIHKQESHGKLTWYSGVTDDDYIDGELRYEESEYDQ